MQYINPDKALKGRTFPSDAFDMNTLDLTLAGCSCPHDITLHRREVFTHKTTGEPVPAVVCDDPACWCFQSRS